MTLNRFETSLVDDEQALTAGLQGPNRSLTPNMLLAISFRAEEEARVARWPQKPDHHPEGELPAQHKCLLVPTTLLTSCCVCRR